LGIEVERIDEEIKSAKSIIADQGVDFKEAFESMDARIEDELKEIETLVSQGLSPIPDIDFKDLRDSTTDFADLVRKRGCVVIRNVFSEDRVNEWNNNLMGYVRDNNYFDKQAEKAGMDSVSNNS